MQNCTNGGGVRSSSDQHNGTHVSSNDVSEDETVEYAPIIKAPKHLSTKNRRKHNKNNGFFTERQQELIRLIGQALRDLGLEKTAEELVEESGFHFENPLISRFRASVLNGNWEQAISELQNLRNKLNDSSAFQNVKFAILEQKFLELLDDGNFARALTCLQSELSCMSCDRNRLQQLSISFFVPPDMLRRHVGLNGQCRENRQQVVDKIQGFLPECMMLPPARLQNLLSQAVENQRRQCRFHNTKLFDSVESVSLLSDHKCSKERLPCTLKQTLGDHCDEVLHLKFSPDGNFLATGSRDRCLIIWSVNKETHQLTRYSTQEWRPMSYVTWSPDSRLVLTCGVDDCTEVMIFDVQLSSVRLKTNLNGDDSLTCGCFVGQNGEYFATGGIRGQIYLCGMNGTIVKQVEGIRLQDIAWMPGTRSSVVIADSHSRLRLYNFDERSDKQLVKEDQRILSFSLSVDGHFAAVNVLEHGVHLWDLRQKRLIRKMFGFVQSTLAIYSTFGGHHEDFVASGSEDGLVRIWHKNFEDPVAVLEGHTKPVNCVHWNPAMCSMLASCSDDTLVHIWTTADSCCSDEAQLRKGNQNHAEVSNHLSNLLNSTNNNSISNNNGSNNKMPNEPSIDGSSHDEAMIVESNPSGLFSDEDGAASEEDNDDDIDESNDDSDDQNRQVQSTQSDASAVAVRMVASGVGAAEVVAALMAGAPLPPPQTFPIDTNDEEDDNQSGGSTGGSAGLPGGSSTSESGGF